MQNNFNNLGKLIQLAQVAENPIAFLQNQALNSPLIQKVFELGKQYNGDYDAATRDILKAYKVDENQARTYLSQLGIK